MENQDLVLIIDINWLRRNKNGIIGNKYGKLLVLNRVENDKNGYIKFKCLCECGNETIVYKSNLINGHTKSCGCNRSKNAKKLFTKHGMSNTIIHKIWIEMNHRCYLKSDTNYKKYGARGIIVCDKWKNDFMAFYDWAMLHGYNDNLTLDRIDNDGNYEPNNCRWATYSQQNKNRRSFKKCKN